MDPSGADAAPAWGLAMQIDTSLEPIRAGAFTVAEARHLLRRAGFGPEPGEAERLAAMGLDAAVEHVVDYRRHPLRGLPRPRIDPDLKPYWTPEEREQRRRARQGDDQETLDQLSAAFLARRDEDRRQLRELQQWWLEHMIRTPRPLEEQLTLLWHGHFATRHRNVRHTALMHEQNMMFREHAAGSFADLARAIVRDPAMIIFLDNHRNFRRNPNENLARELFELFTLGEGNYTEQDIAEAARALTGYHLDEDRRFAFNVRQHDPTRKRILGARGAFDGDDVVDLALRQEACARFVCYKLYNHFVADHVEQTLPTYQQTVILAMARTMRRHEYRIAPVLEELFKSRHFYDPQLRGQKVKSPAHLLVGTTRMCQLPMRRAAPLRRAMNQMGQTLFDPPSVAGWPGGRMWINTSTLFVRQNLVSFLVTGQPRPRERHGIRHADYDPMVLVADLEKRTPEAVVDALVDRLVGEHVPAERREPLARHVAERGDTVRADAVAGLLMLIGTMPEYQLC